MSLSEPRSLLYYEREVKFKGQIPQEAAQTHLRQQWWSYCTVVKVLPVAWSGVTP